MIQKFNGMHGMGLGLMSSMICYKRHLLLFLTIVNNLVNKFSELEK